MLYGLLGSFLMLSVQPAPRTELFYFPFKQSSWHPIKVTTPHLMYNVTSLLEPPRLQELKKILLMIEDPSQAKLKGIRLMIKEADMTWCVDAYGTVSDGKKTWTLSRKGQKELKIFLVNLLPQTPNPDEDLFKQAIK